MVARLERLLQAPPRANTSSMQEDVPREPQEEGQGGPTSRVESSSHRSCGNSRLAPAHDRTEPPLRPPKAPTPEHRTKTSALGPQTQGHATSEGRIMACSSQEEVCNDSSSPEGR